MAEKASRKDKNQNIQVFVRLRPLNQRERDIRSVGVIEVSQSREVVVRQSNQNSLTKKFTFDRAFPPHSKQVEIYQEVVSPLIEEVLSGYNCTVFAYGQTGTGKTHTMVGEASGYETTWQNDPEAGIIPRALSQLFDELRLSGTEYTVRVSYLELYNEELFDLLSNTEDNSKLRIYEDVTRKGSNIVNGLEDIAVYNKNEVYKIMAQGQERKRMASTLMNAQSSRSHTVFTIVVHMKENSPEGEELVKIGKLNLVDLAGSENISKAGSDNPSKRERARECVNINQSLLTLGRVITALVERHPHIPYRESKLTRILQESLGGRTKTSIIATISPGHKDLEETLSTLEYAHRAKNIQNKPEVNQKMTKKAILKQYSEEIDKLKRDLMSARDKNGVYLSEETYSELTLKQEEQRKEILEMILKQRAMEEERERIEKMFSELNGQLFTERQKREETNKRLCATRNQLADTSHMLEKTRLHFEEQRHLVEKQQETESSLSAQAQEILQVADVAANDVHSLHNSIDKRRCVESSNLEVTRAYREISAQHLSNIACRTQQHQANVNVALLDIHNVANTNINSNCNTLTECRMQIDDLIKSENDTFGKVTCFAEESSASAMSATSSAKQRVSSSMAAQREGVHATFANYSRFMSECLQRAIDTDTFAEFEKCLKHWHGEVARRTSLVDAGAARWAQNCSDASDRHATVAGSIADSLQCWRAHFSQRVQRVLDEIREDKIEAERRNVEQKSKIEEEAKDFEAQLSSWAEKERREYEQRLESHVTSQKKLLEERTAERMRKIDEEQKRSMNKDDCYVEFINEIKAESEKQISAVVGLLEENDRVTHNHQDTAKAMFSECAKATASVATACDELNVNAQRLVAQTKDDFIRSIGDMRTCVSDETTKALQASDEEAAQVTSELTQVLDKNTQSWQASVSAITHEMQKLTTKTVTALTTLASNNDDVVTKSREQQRWQDEALMTLQQATQDYTNCVTGEVSGLQQLESKCLQEQYIVYSPTGKTPARKAYQYPRKLAATSPHERILARYRAAQLPPPEDTDTQIISDTEETREELSSEDSEVAIEPTSPIVVHVNALAKSTSESELHMHKKITQGKENMSQSMMMYKKPSKLPSLYNKKPLIDKN